MKFVLKVDGIELRSDGDNMTLTVQLASMLLNDLKPNCHDIREMVRTLYKTGGIIPAVKLYRQHQIDSGKDCPLIDAKRYVEDNCADVKQDAR